MSGERLWPDTPVFGDAIPGVTYGNRPGAYALICDEADRVALVAVGSGLYLPGGGCEAGETPQEALRREVLEECGVICEVNQFLGEAVEFLHVPSEHCYFRKHGYFFTATIPAGSVRCSHVRWLSPAEAVLGLRHASQSWVMSRFADAFSSFRPK